MKKQKETPILGTFGLLHPYGSIWGRIPAKSEKNTPKIGVNRASK